MSYQGLFTQGTTVDELLAKRSKRQQDMQQQLMNQAAQGARDPQRARMGSMFGSILGRALGNNAGGADTEVEAIKAKEASTKDLRARMATALSDRTNPSGKMELAKDLMNSGHVQEAGQIIELFDKIKKDNQDKLALSVKGEDDLVAKEEETASNERLAEQLKGKIPSTIIQNIINGDKKAIAYGYSKLDSEAGALSTKVFEAYGEGYEPGTPLNRKIMQEQMSKSSSTEVNVSIDSNGNQDLTKTQRSKQQEKLIGVKSQLNSLDSIGKEFNDDYFTYQGAALAKVGAFFDKLGVKPSTPVIGEAVDFNTKRVTQIAEIDMLFNLYRKEITGAAAAVAELEALKKAYLNADRGAEATKAMIVKLKDIGERGYEELKANLADGIDLTPADSPIDWNNPSSYDDAALNASYDKAIREAEKAKGAPL